MLSYNEVKPKILIFERDENEDLIISNDTIVFYPNLEDSLKQIEKIKDNSDSVFHDSIYTGKLIGRKANIVAYYFMRSLANYHKANFIDVTSSKPFYSSFVGSFDLYRLDKEHFKLMNNLVHDSTDKAESLLKMKLINEPVLRQITGYMVGYSSLAYKCKSFINRKLLPFSIER